jgi:hypothetical protein
MRRTRADVCGAAGWGVFGLGRCGKGGPSLKGWVGEGVGVPRYVLLYRLCLILYAPGLASIPPVDRDEARFAQRRGRCWGPAILSGSLSGGGT